MAQTRTARRPRTTPRESPTAPPESPRERFAPEPTAAAIAERAYERFLMRRQEHGKDLDDWLEAERELRDSQRR